MSYFALRNTLYYNNYLQVDFLDALSEPNPKYRSFDFVWTLAYHIFEHTRVWAYKTLTVVFGLPIAMLGRANLPHLTVLF